MLTKIVGDRVYDFSHVVGGRNEVMGPVSLTPGLEGDMFAVITRIDRTCEVTRFHVGNEAGEEEVIGRMGTRGEEPGQFIWPSGISIDPESNVYVTDAWLNRVSVFNREGTFLRMFGEPGEGKGQFKRPSGIQIDEEGNVLVVDTHNHRVQKLTPDGQFIFEWGVRGSDVGQFDSPWGITTDSDGFIYVADHKNHRIQKFDAEGNFALALGSHGSGNYEFDHPSDVAIDPNGDIYVCDWANHRVQAYDSEGSYLTTFIGDAQELSKWQMEYVRSNPDVYKARRRVYTLEPEWRFALPTGVAFDTQNSRLMVADTQRWRVQIYNKLLDYSDPQFNI